MYAIVDIAGQQFKVAKDQKLYVHRLEGNAGDKVQFDDVLLVDNNGKVAIGAPVIDGAAVKAKILEHLKGDKVIVFKKKRRKGYKVKNGHRQYLTSIEIEEIVEKGAKRAAAKKEAAKPAAKKAAPAKAKEEAPKAEAKKEAPKAEKKAAKPKAEKKEAAPKAKAEEAPKAEETAPAAEAPKAEAKPKAPKAEAKAEKPAKEEKKEKAPAKPKAEKAPEAPADKPAEGEDKEEK